MRRVPVCERCNERFWVAYADLAERRLVFYCLCIGSGPYCWRRVPGRPDLWQLWSGWPADRWLNIAVEDGVARVPAPAEVLGLREEVRA